ncbi:MAG: hypothetical protein GAK35_02372 [Herbaspirillum frisingense]|uniref:Terminase large subunit n=1 Tax=Herbaspirillum frisingense TaxID=92645 RepID=A0A7V8FWI1_9BURK|nr:MAG: hypothetical protein GAK35_02372 [Herbaspirillum frisingense]
MPQTDSSAPIDRCTQYAQDVVSKKIVAGPHVRAACRRHLKDLEEGAARGLRWNLDEAQRVIAFFEEVLVLNGGEFEGKPFTVLDWQAFVLGSLFGWQSADGSRRYRVAYVETAKGSGKSPLAAGIGLYGLTADREMRAEIYAAATKKDQAQVLFRDAVAMYDQSPRLRQRLVPSGSKGKEYNLAYHATSSFFKTISADDGQSGPRPHMGILDEIHEHKNALVVEMMRAGTKSRRQALIFMITNSGSDLTSVCGDYHEYGRQVCDGTLQDDSFFGFICGMDKDDDPFKDESCWAKANPSLHHGIPGLKYLREQVTQARGMPSKEALVKRLNFCMWTGAVAPWLAAETWFACEDPDMVDMSRYYGRTGTGGLDLSSTQDLTAFVVSLDPTEDDPFTRLFPYFWLPGDNLERKGQLDRVPYLAWKEAGHLFALSGRAVDKLAVLQKVSEVAAYFNLRHINCDRWRLEDYRQLAEREDVSLPEFQPFGQGMKDMAPAVDEFERQLVAGTLRHNGNPVMTWNAANAVLASDDAGNRKVTKQRARGRVDGVVAGVMAVAGTLALETEEDMDDFFNDPIRT